MTNGFIMIYKNDDGFTGQVTFSNGFIVHVARPSSDRQTVLTECETVADDRNINIFSTLDA